MHEITINGKPFELHAVTGRVAAANKQLETRVHGGGGGGYTYQGTGHTAPVHITSTTVTHDQIYVVDGSGQEHALRLQNWNIACREGHELIAVWLIKKGKSSGPYVAIRNSTINETKYDDKELAKLHRPWWPLGTLLLPFVLHFSGLSIVIVIAALGWRHYLGIKGRNEIKASGQLFSAVEA
jgi:hypothetical protein